MARDKGRGMNRVEEIDLDVVVLGNATAAPHKHRADQQVTRDFLGPGRPSRSTRSA